MDHSPVLERTRQVAPPEPRQPSPQPHIPRRRVLRLQSAYLLNGFLDGERGPFEEQLPRKKGAVQGMLRKDGLGHRPIIGQERLWLRRRLEQLG